MNGRRGITLLETIVIIAIIGILIGLLLPSIQASREQARKASCGNNMTQLWYAIQAYESAYSQFPAGTLAVEIPVREFPTDYHHGWLTRIAPYLDQGPRFSKAIDRSLSIYDPKNFFLQKSYKLPTLQCPSSWHGSENYSTSYAGIHDGRPIPVQESSRGVFIANRFLTRRDIRDGLSNTLFIGEQNQTENPGLGWMSGTNASLRSTGVPIIEPDDSDFMFNYSMDAFEGANTYDAYAGFLTPPQTYDQYLEMSSKKLEITKETLESEYSVASIQDALFELADQAEFPDDDGAGEISPGFEMGMEMEMGMGTGMEMQAFPLMPLGAAALQAKPLGSSHQGSQAIFGDGNVRYFDNEVDREFFAQLGMRDDQLPLIIPNR